MSSPAAVAAPVPAGYRPHLDGLRAIAILAVLLSHFLPMDHPVRVTIPWAELGVLCSSRSADI
jgi:peptidoglycan/LPS O-acetylase OafA/YrhL